jgi:hypothetical protein
MRLIIYQQHQELNSCFYCNRTTKHMSQQQDANAPSIRLHILSVSEVEALLIKAWAEGDIRFD